MKRASQIIWLLRLMRLGMYVPTWMLFDSLVAALNHYGAWQLVTVALGFLAFQSLCRVHTWVWCGGNLAKTARSVGVGSDSGPAFTTAEIALILAAWNLLLVWYLAFLWMWPWCMVCIGLSVVPVLFDWYVDPDCHLIVTEMLWAILTTGIIATHTSIAASLLFGTVCAMYS